MKVVPKHDRASQVEPHLPDERIERMWQKIEAKQDGPRLPARGLAMACALAVACALALFATRAMKPATAPMQAAGDIRQDAAVTGSAVEGDRVLTLTDGSTLTFGPHTHVTILEGAGPHRLVKLEDGRLVSRIAAGDGTFTLQVGAQRIELAPGEHEIVREEDGQVRARARTGALTVRDEHGSTVALVQPGAEWSEAESSRTAGWVSPLPSAHPSGKPTAHPTPQPSASAAQEAFGRAERARLQGSSEQAALAYEEFFRAHAADQRAAIAALEAGRLRLRNGAFEAARRDFSFAKDNGAEPFREDAHAGLVEALGALDRAQECSDARDAFVGRYPNSPHRERVERRCR